MANAQKIGTIKQFSPPGYVDDLTPKQAEDWSATISGWMDKEISGQHVELPYRNPLTQFFNGRKTSFNLDQRPASISWIGFPKKVNLLTAPCC
ncbi:hypothetical protein GGS26DRAFT_524387 [Hypomontagnella submonticulosa]|nr:hypothetical protein GGS26DRAFT_524387 [Hypomontagnella submonticulosa]